MIVRLFEMTFANSFVLNEIWLWISYFDTTYQKNKNNNNNCYFKAESVFYIIAFNFDDL